MANERFMTTFNGRNTITVFASDEKANPCVGCPLSKPTEIKSQAGHVMHASCSGMTEGIADVHILGAICEQESKETKQKTGCRLDIGNTIRQRLIISETPTER